MNNLSFEFMEKTKNVPLAIYSTQDIYKIKSLLTLFWIFCSHIFTSFIFFSNFIFFCGISLCFIILLSQEKKTIKNKWEQLFFLLVIYCFLPFYTPLVFLFFIPIITLIIMEYLFKFINGYFINPALLILVLIFCISPNILSSYQTVNILYIHHYRISDFLYSFSLIDSTNFYKEFLGTIFGFFAYSPALFLGFLGFVLYFLPFIPRIIYRNSFLYVLAILIFSFVYTFIDFLLVSSNFSIWFLYQNFLDRLFLNEPIMFTAIFIIPETLGSIFHYKRSILFTIWSSFFTVLLFIIGVNIFSSLISISISYISFYILSFYLSKEVYKEKL